MSIIKMTKIRNILLQFFQLLQQMDSQILLPDNNLQQKEKMQWPRIGYQVDENRTYTSQIQATMRQLKRCEETLRQSLEIALQINKQLILNSLYSRYSPVGFAQISANRNQVPSEIKIKENLKKDGELENRKQFLRRKLRIKKKRQNYDTKNIPKNFGTAIHIFIKRNSARVKNLLAKKKISYSQFYEFNKEAKEKINSLLHLRELWQHKDDDAEKNLKQCYRIISFEFMRKHCLSYIFGSRIKNVSSHIRYRKKLLEGIEKPHTLFNLKDY